MTEQGFTVDLSLDREDGYSACVVDDPRVSGVAPAAIAVAGSAAKALDKVRRGIRGDRA